MTEIETLQPSAVTTPSSEGSFVERNPLAMQGIMANRRGPLKIRAGVGVQWRFRLEEGGFEDNHRGAGPSEGLEDQACLQSHSRQKKQTELRARLGGGTDN